MKVEGVSPTPRPPLPPGETRYPLYRSGPHGRAENLVPTGIRSWTVQPVVSSYIHTGCPRRNVPDLGRVFLMLKYTNITHNTYIQS